MATPHENIDKTSATACRAAADRVGLRGKLAAIKLIKYSAIEKTHFRAGGNWSNGLVDLTSSL